MTTSPRQVRDCDPVEQQLRQDLLDDLYLRSGRGRKSHPLYSTYTGLWQEWTQAQEQQQQ